MAKKKQKSNRKKPKYKHFREAKPARYDDFTFLEPKFEKYIKTRILPILQFTGYKLKEKKHIATRIVASLWFAETRPIARPVADSRDNRNRTRRTVWDALIDAGLVRLALGSESSGFISRYRMTGQLKAMLSAYDKDRPLINYNLTRNTERKKPSRHALMLVQGSDKKTKKKKALPLKPSHLGVTHHWKEIENNIEKCNRSQLKHRYEVSINPCLRFIHSEQFGRYAMLHSWSGLSFQSLTKEERKNIVIDGKWTIELDFSGFFLRQYYHYRQIEPIRKDIYQPEKLLRCYKILLPKYQKLMRELVKGATIFCLNNANINKAYYVVESEYLKTTKKEQQRSKSDDTTKRTVQKKKICRQILYQTEKINLHVLLDRILRLHKRIKDDFFKPEKYSLTMSISTYMMLEILMKFQENNKAALPIHDSIIVKVQDENFARQTMNEVYKKYHPNSKYSGFLPVISLM